MRFKYNPWVSMVALLLLATILVLLCTGCAPETEAAERDTPTCSVITEANQETEATTETEPAVIGRFSVKWAGAGFPHLNGIYIITDNQTGVQYLFVDNVDSGGLVKMEG